MTASVALNVALAILLILLVVKAKARIKEEKVATFAGCVGAITEGICHKDQGEVFELIAGGLSRLRGGMDRDEIRWRLVRAGFIRLFRNEPALADVAGEHMRALVHQVIRSEEEADLVWAYIDGCLDGRDGFGEPVQKFSQKELSEAQMQFESGITAMYSKTVGPEATKLF